jgi:peroxiredoxin/predicted 2-oxoglutarate/Fe(II)-dependent dioxygenase YbiX
MRQTFLTMGEPAPWFEARCTSNPRYHFDTVGGHPVVLCFFQSAADPASQRILQDFQAHANRFCDGVSNLFFGVSVDPADEQLGRVHEQVGMRFFWDFDFSVSKLYGSVTNPTSPGDGYRRQTVLLDQQLRVIQVFPFDDHPETHVARVMAVVDEIPPAGPFVAAQPQAPVLIVPRVFEPELCRQLIDYYEQHGGQESGFMRQIDGKTVGMYDFSHKRRRDQEILDERLRRSCMVRIHDRLIPEIEKAFQFRATRMERYIVACYDAETQGHFNRHRDNTTTATAHRKFAISLVLNTGEFEGGYVWFPEYGRQLFCPPAGGAVVFSCSLLHEATRVTRGKRYVFLPFVYDEAAAKLRRQNEASLGGMFNTPEDGAALAEEHRKRASSLSTT